LFFFRSWFGHYLASFWGCCFSEKYVMLHEEKEGSMPTQDERLSTVEQSVAILRKGLADIHHNETILLGVVEEQGKDIREMKVSLAALNERVGAFEQGMQDRFEALDGRLGTFEHGVRERFQALEGHLGTFEQSVNSRFGEQDKKLDDVGRLLLQVLDRLPPS
jgi:hypothetical protein